MANNPDEHETYHEVPASKYWYLGDTIGAVPKNFFKFWTPFTFFLGVTLTAIILLTDWIEQLLYKIFLGSHWYAGWIIIFFVIIISILTYEFKHRGEQTRTKSQE